jgi:protocatechuate 3,4-dioxygenase beta subunit
VDIEPAAILELGPGPGIPPTTAAGEKLVIVGTVYTEDCTPLVGAMLNVWQTDANGEYGPDHGSNDMRCCYLMGSLRTDAHGHYQLVTVKPAHYKGEQLPPPAHIHIEISHPQTGPSQTEIVFAGDPYLPQTLQGYVLVTLETVPGPEGAAGYLRGAADIIMERSDS